MKSRKIENRILRYTPADKARHDRMVALVERMLELNAEGPL